MAKYQRLNDESSSQVDRDREMFTDRSNSEFTKFVPENDNGLQNPSSYTPTNVIGNTDTSRHPSTYSSELSCKLCALFATNRL